VTNTLSPLLVFLIGENLFLCCHRIIRMERECMLGTSVEVEGHAHALGRWFEFKTSTNLSGLLLRRSIVAGSLHYDYRHRSFTFARRVREVNGRCQLRMEKPAELRSQLFRMPLDMSKCKASPL
jgi:hypothetical protein